LDLNFVKYFQPTKTFGASMAYFFGLVDLLPNENASSESIVLKQFISNEHYEKLLLLFPEGASTNGKCALLR